MNTMHDYRVNRLKKDKTDDETKYNIRGHTINEEIKKHPTEEAGLFLILFSEIRQKADVSLNGLSSARRSQFQ